MARYIPGVPSGDLTSFIVTELSKIGQAMETQDEQLNLKTLYAEPKKFRDGTIVRADGTTWKPNGTGGAGVYCYYGGSWKLLG